MIEHVLVLSTAHIRPETAEKMMSFDLVIYEKQEFGWFIYVHSLSLEPALLDGLPEDLVKCVDLARKSACDWLMFDRDASVITDLPTYSWD